jgi:phosphate acyltransferase
VKIALDAMGGDLAPKAVVEGAVMASRDLGVDVILVGDREIVGRELAEHDLAGATVQIEHAAEVVLMDDSPLESLMNKPQSSIHVAMEMVKAGRADGFVSAGNSGAVMAAAMAILGDLQGIDRPAIGSVVPTAHGLALLIDAGANVEVKPVNLVQFAVMGSVYWRQVRGVAQPRVGILSNGEEASKGTDLTRAAAAMLRDAGALVNYIGYVEGRDINRGNADVIVTDGFTGNVALKTMEGFASFMSGKLREVLGGSWRGRLAYLLVRKRLGAMRAQLDPHEYGGAPLLGVNGLAIIAHGSSNAVAIRNAVRAAANEALARHVNSEIVEILTKIQPVVQTAKPAGKGFRSLFSRMRERLHRHPRDHRAGETGHTGELPHIPEPAAGGNHIEPLAKDDREHGPAVVAGTASAAPSTASNGSHPESAGDRAPAQPRDTGSEPQPDLPPPDPPKHEPS